MMENRIYRLIRKFTRNNNNVGLSAVIEAPADFYNEAYSHTQEYFIHYTNSRYYFVWTVILDRILRISSDVRVLEIGCGPGQLAQLLLDNGIASYHGFDFSSKAVDLAKKKELANAIFHVGDAYCEPLIEKSASSFDCVICTEVLEHLDRDLEVIKRLEPGTRLIATVPNFPYVSHVRHFENAESVRERYQPYLSDFSVLGLRQPTPSNNVYWIFEGRVKPNLTV
jgi:2-polyprenyl-3-methyl-5-hydroxy-6-metoxy-1,4-benzoquinol methylase